jgi:hypothetical protein
MVPIIAKYLDSFLDLVTMYAENDLLFPSSVIQLVKDRRGPEFKALAERVLRFSEDHPRRLAFCLMMIRLNGCLGCETDSYRAMRGCYACTVQELRRYKGTDAEILESYDVALADVHAYLETVEAQRFYGPLITTKAA